MKTKTLLIASAVLSASALNAQSLLYEFSFNNPAEGTSTTSTAPAGSTANFTDYVEVGSTARVAANLHGANQSGVSGLSGDYAFNNSGSTIMGGSGGTPGYGGMAQVTNGSNLLNNSTSFTISGWYNGATAPANSARLIEVGNLGVWFQFVAGSGAGLQLSARIDDPSASAQTIISHDNSIRTANVWTFFAVTYDGTTGTANLFGGSDANSVSLLATADFGEGIVATGANQALTIGNSTGNNNQRPFDGLMDNFRIWGDAEGAAGALSLSQLEGVRLADMTNSPIPEPSAFAVLAGLGALAFTAARRRRRA